MDPISLAIVSGLSNLSQNVIKDAYQALKVAIAHKCGVSSDLVKAVENLEQKPESNGRQEMLKEEVNAAKLDQDPELLKVASTLLEKIKELPGSQTSITQTVSGNNNVVSGTGNINITNHPKVK